MVKYKVQEKKKSGQLFIYIPAFARKQLNLKAGMFVDIELDGNRLIVRAL